MSYRLLSNSYLPSAFIMEILPVQSPLETLPLELLSMVFSHVILPASPKTLICCWQSPLPLPFISNISCHKAKLRPENVKRYSSGYETLSLVNRHIYSEVTHLFYMKHTFRINIAQLGTLLSEQHRHILRKLHRLEIENVNHGDHSVGPTALTSLFNPSLVENIDQIVVGSRCYDMNLPQAAEIYKRHDEPILDGIKPIHHMRCEALRLCLERVDRLERVRLQWLLGELDRMKFPKLQTISGLSYSHDRRFDDCTRVFLINGREFTVLDLEVRAMYGLKLYS